MLKVVNLQKIYNAGTETEVRALDGVTLEFPEKGMVFLLGRSGSGKSTLLNVAGGLDAPTEGEIIVKGKSSKDFSQSDFDSYRNTFVGFIFQEYNILNEFSVEDNIALALELQGKPKDKEAVAALLEQVDLSGYAKRKPNTLSGGQKQRIAIARALIKSPEIIMADEPTGALDSNTGKQVFDTLKKLSQDKLVIIVSHDREFAEQYGDRIIELKDGKILSDVSKTTVAGDAVSKNVSSLGDVLCIKKGSDLTENDFEEIKKFLKETDGDVVIANGEKSVGDFKKVSRIRDTGEKEVFAETDESKQPKKQYGKDDAKFIRSRLPLRHAVRIGLSGLKTKPVRLFFTILLCTIAFVLFGLLSTLSFYDSEATFKQTLREGTISSIGVRKDYTGIERYYQNGELENEYNRSEQARLSDADLEEYRNTFGDGVFGGVTYYGGSLSVRTRGSAYYKTDIYTYAYLPEWNSLRSTLATYPQTRDEIVISSYLAEVLVECGANDADGNPMTLTSTADVIGKTININGDKYKVVGILDSGTIPEKYAVLKEETVDDRSLEREFEYLLQDGYHQMVFVSRDTLDRFSTMYSYSPNSPTQNREIGMAHMNEEGNLVFQDGWMGYYYQKHSDYSGQGKYVPIVDGKTAPAQGEAIVPLNILSEMIGWMPNKTDEEANAKLNEARDLLWRANSTSYFKPNYNEETGEFVGEEEIILTDEERIQFVNEAITLLKESGVSLQITTRFWSHRDQAYFGNDEKFNIVGIYLESIDNYEKQRIVYLSDADEERLWSEQKPALEWYSEFETAYKEKPGSIYNLAYLPFDGSEKQIDGFWQIYQEDEFGEDATRLSVVSSSLDTLQMVDGTVKEMSKIFLYVGLVLAVFAALLFSNFISVSISQKKREIGILRAVGARGTDVFKIFFSESFFISLICVILSTAGCLVLSSVLNTSLAEGLGASLFVFGIASFAVLVGIALLTAVVATFLPVFNAARKKPVDSIRSL